MPSASDTATPRCLLCAMHCPIGAGDDGLGHVGSVFPADMGIAQGACVRGLTAARLMGAPERLFTARRGAEPVSVQAALQAMAESAAGSDTGRAAVVADLNRPLEGVLSLAGLCRQVGARFAAFIPPEDGAFVRAGLTACPPFEQMADCDVLLAVGDPFSSHPAVAAHVRDMQFGGRGHRLIALDTNWSRTCRGAEQALVVHPLKLSGVMAALAVECGAEAVGQALGGKSAADICADLDVSVDRLQDLAAALRGASSPGILISHSAGRYAAGGAVVAAAKALGAALTAKVWPLLVATNSAAVPRLKELCGALELADIIREAESGGVDVLLAVGFDPASVLPEGLWGSLRDKCGTICWAGSLDNAFARQADYVLPLALPWEEEGTVLDSGGRPAACVAWTAKPAGVLSVTELAGRLAALAGAEPVAADVAQLVPAAGATAAAADLIGPDILSVPEPGQGQAVLIGAPEPQGYTGGLSLGGSEWQRRIAAEESACVSGELASEVGLSDQGMLELNNGTAMTVRCEVAPQVRGRVVAVPAHWKMLRDMLHWRDTEGTIEPAPAVISVRKCD